MKTLRLIGMMSILCLALIGWSCGGENTSEQSEEVQTEVQHGEGKEYTSAYVCPMHCDGSGGEEAGKCPVCGMDYVALADHTEDGHTH